MERREWIQGLLAGSGALAGVQALAQTPVRTDAAEPGASEFIEDVVIERPAAGRPHAGKVLVAIQPHSDDVALFAGGTVAKLIREGYTGHLIRTTNDEMTGGGTRGDSVLRNERDNDALAKALGLDKVFNLGYRNHRLDAAPLQDLKGRLIFLFRLLRPDTVICYDPWGLYEENPDHYVTAKAVEAACWMAGMTKDYPEHFAAGLKPHSVTDKYYFARGPQVVNRVVDIGPTIDIKVAANQALVQQGPSGQAGARLRAELAKRGQRLPLLGSNDASANHAYIKNFVLDLDSEAQRATPSDRVVGQRYGLEWAERFHYIQTPKSEMTTYLKQHATAL